MYLSLSSKFLIYPIQEEYGFSKKDSSFFNENPYLDKNNVFYKCKYTQSFTNSTLDSIDKYTNYITKK